MKATLSGQNPFSGQMQRKSNKLTSLPRPPEALIAWRLTTRPHALRSYPSRRSGRLFVLRTSCRLWLRPSSEAAAMRTCCCRVCFNALSYFRQDSLDLGCCHISPDRRKLLALKSCLEVTTILDELLLQLLFFFSLQALQFAGAPVALKRSLTAAIFRLLVVLLHVGA